MPAEARLRNEKGVPEDSGTPDCSVLQVMEEGLS
jgi:hypothetical protein